MKSETNVAFLSHGLKLRGSILRRTERGMKLYHTRLLLSGLTFALMCISALINAASAQTAATNPPTSPSAGTGVTIITDPYRGVANQGPYIDAIYQEQENNAKNNQQVSLVEEALMAFGSASGGGAVAASLPTDTRSEGNPNSDSPTSSSSTTSPSPAQSAGARNGQVVSAGAEQTAYVPNWGPYSAFQAMLSSETSNTLLNTDAHFTKVTQTNIATCLANAAVCQGKSAAVQAAGFLLQQGRNSRADFERALEENPSIKSWFEECKRREVRNNSTASYDEVMYRCMGDMYRPGSGAAQRPAPAIVAWNYNQNQAGTALAGGNPTAALTNSSPTNGNQSINTKAGTVGAAVASGMQCGDETNEGVDLLSNLIYKPAIDYLKSNVLARTAGLDLRGVLEARRAFRAYYGDAKFTKSLPTGGGSTTAAGFAEIGGETVNPYVCDGGQPKQQNSLGVLRRSMAMQVVDALLAAGDPNAQDEWDKPGLLVERCTRVNAIKGTFRSSQVSGGTTTDTVSEFCRPNDNSQLYRRSVLHLGNISFSPQYCEAAWYLAKSFLENQQDKGVTKLKEGLIEYKCDVLAELGKDLRSQFGKSDLKDTIKVTGRNLRKPDLIIFVQLWGIVKGYLVVENSLPSKVLSHISQILVQRAVPNALQLAELAQTIVVDAHKETVKNGPQALEAFNQYIAIVLKVVADAQTGSQSLLVYGSGQGASPKGASGS